MVNHKLRKATIGVFIAAIFLSVCCSSAFPKVNPFWPRYDYNQAKIPSATESQFTKTDTLIFDIIDVLTEATKLSDSRKKEIERKIRSFPKKVIWRDTTTFFLETVLEMSYNEFVDGNLENFYKTGYNFTDKVQELNPISIPIKYSLIKFASFRIKEREEREESRKNSSFSISESSQFSPHNLEITKFIIDLLPDLPTDLPLQTYIYILDAFEKAGGFPRLAVNITADNIFEKWRKAKREDILDYVAAKWKLDEDVVEHVNRPSEKSYLPTEEPEGFYDDEHPRPYPKDLDKVVERNLKELALQIWDTDGNIAVIDSLLSVGETDSIGKYMNNYQILNWNRGKTRNIIEMSEEYEKYIPMNWQPAFYGYWGIAHYALGEFEEAKLKFEKSFDKKADKNKFSGSVLNYAMAVAETGDPEEAIRLFKTQEGKPKSIKDQFAYWDGLGYVYSFIYPSLALECYEKADSVIMAAEGPNFNGNFFINWPPNNVCRHYVRKCRVVQNDLFQWRNTLRQARLASGVDSYFSFYGGLPSGIYHSELGRFKTLLFDFEGAGNDFDRAKEIFSDLDPQDYRWKLLVESANYLRDFNDNCSKDLDTVLSYLQSDEYSSLHKIWLIGNFITIHEPNQISTDELNFIIESLKKHYAESILALSSFESSNLPKGIIQMQNILMSQDSLFKEPGNLLNLNLLRKGILQTSKIALEKNILANSQSKKNEYTKLIGLRKELNHAYAYEDSLKIRKLLPQIANIESELYHSLKDSINFGEHIGGDINLIRNKLGENDVAIDFVQFIKNNETKTGAFVLMKEADPVYVDLTRNIHDTGSDYPDYSKIWQPLKEYIEGKGDIYFSPDGDLWKEGLEFFADTDGEPMISNHRLHRLSHLRDIEKDYPAFSGEIAIIGVSDHNSPVGNSENLYRGNWTDLPNVEYEISLIENTLQDRQHLTYFNDEALEENIKNLEGKDISVVHFSTHGVYRDFDSLNNAAGDSDSFDHNIALRTLKSDQSEISGLILRRGNLSWQMPHILDDEDDILTAEEIENMSFPNLQLTVLSACDSGLGEINSDGIRGLQRAFRIAGSRKIICSLNKVNDHWSAEFMGQLYGNLAQGQSIYDAFRNAGESIREATPDNKEAWSSYILIE